MRNEKLIHALGKCINACNYCADACLHEENVKMMVNCIQTDKVCAEVCSTLNQILLTSYTDVEGLIQYCIKVCTACGDECAKHDHDHCQECAKACKACVAACESYIGATA